MTTREAEIASNARAEGISYQEAEREWEQREAFHRKMQRYISAAMDRADRLGTR